MEEERRSPTADSRSAEPSGAHLHRRLEAKVTRTVSARSPTGKITPGLFFFFFFSALIFQVLNFVFQRRIDFGGEAQNPEEKILNAAK